MSTRPRLSIVIPTCDRREAVLRTLAALERQSVAPESYEVIVVANGCRDATADAVRALRPAHALCVLELGTANVSAARNAGAEAAQAPYVAFLDDDIEVEAGFVEAHLRAHARAPTDSREPLVVVGYLAGRLQPEEDLFAIALRGWWEAMFDRLRDPGRRRAYTDVLSGNVSLRRDVFRRVGGFDETLSCHEDYELGYRLIRRGCRIVFAEAARGTHRDATRLPRACARKRDEGRADARLAERYPELRSALPMAQPRTLRRRLTEWLAFDLPPAGDLAARAISAVVLPVLERTAAMLTWYRVLYWIFGYWYARGLADALGSRAAMRALLLGTEQDAALNDPGLAVDLARGIDAARALVETERPLALTIRVGDRTVSRLPHVPGTEPLRAIHLDAALTTTFHRPAFESMLDAGVPELAEDPVPTPRGGDLLPDDLASVTSR